MMAEVCSDPEAGEAATIAEADVMVDVEETAEADYFRLLTRRRS